MKRTAKQFWAGVAACGAAALWFGVAESRGEAILQVFNQSHNEIAARLPEIAEAGYTALWVPPPTKANGGMSVGYDLNDPFDIGNSDLRGTWSTRYGVEADLHNLIEKCHRFGMRVYFDNVMNHRSYDIPGYNESTPIDVYPGMCPEDFHVRTTSDGFYRKWDNVRSWDDEWQVMFLGLSDLLDIAHENYYDGYGNGPFNANFGSSEGGWHLKPYIIRYAYHKEDTWKLFDRMPWPGSSNDTYRIGGGALQQVDDTQNVNLYTGFGNKSWNPDDPAIAQLISDNAAWFDEHDARNGVSMKLIEDFPNFYKEQVDDYLYRAVRWLIDTTYVDGLRLDAVKHVPYDFFGASYGNDKNSSKYGYLGQAQWQFNMTRGFNDWEDQRDSVFNIDAPRNDLMAFGEHLGSPPAQGPYVDTGMRLVDDRLRNELNWRFSANQLDGFDNEYAGSELGPDCGVMHAQSHDNDYVDRKPLHHAMYFMRRGLGLVYSDGNNHAATLSGSGGAFPRWAQTDFLGQWGQRQIPTLLHAHENFARGGQWGRWSQGNFIAWQRGDGGDANGMTMLFQLNSAWDWWEPTKVGGEEFPRDTYLYDYASDMYMPYFENAGPEAAYAMGYDIQDGKINLPPNSYAIWSWKNPDPSDLYPTPYPDCFTDSDPRRYAPDSRVITLMENGHVAKPVYVTRKDGVDGDPNFNPYNVADTNATDYSYTIALPCITNGTDVTLEVKADGSAEWLHLRLDGGMDFGNWNHQEEGDWRDNPPGVSSDFLLGFENCSPYFNKRMWAELIASADTPHCKIGTAGATSYEVALGSAPVAHEYEGEKTTDDLKQVGFVYHDPNADSPATTVIGGTTNTTVTTVTRKLNASSSPVDFDSQTVSGVAGFGTVAAVGNNYQDKTTCWAGFFSDGSCVNGGITGFADNVSYGLYANPAGSGANAEFGGEFTDAAGLSTVSVTLGINKPNVDNGNSYKGFAFLDADGNDIFGIQQVNTNAVTYYGAASGTWAANTGTKAFTVTLTENANGYRVTGTTHSGGSITPFDISTTKKIARWKAYMNAAEANASDRQLYFNDLTYTASVTNTEVISGTTVACKQFHLDGNTPVVYAKTPKTSGVAVWLYYTADGDSWPEGAGGVPANPQTQALPGGYFEDNDGSSDWWCFTLPAQPAGTTLRYKIGAARVKNEGGDSWGSLWPSGGTEVYQKTKMMSHWTIPHLHFLTQQDHKHNDSDTRTWVTGFKDGYHLVTARMLLGRNDGAAIPNTFRQTFYLDTHVPDGQILYPASDGETIGGRSYGLVLQTDDTVEKVYYHITDGTTLNDGVGNGKTTNGVVEWAEATLSGAWNREMATNTAMPKVWAFNYNGIAPRGTGDAVIRVRLCEVSSTPTNLWSTTAPDGDRPEDLHVKELVRTVHTDGDNKYVYFSWPSVSNEMVQAGWKVWVRFTGNLIEGDNVNAEDVYSHSTVYINTTNNAATNRGDRVEVEWSDFSWPDNWDGGKGECQMAFTMPNVYNGKDDFSYLMTVEIDKTDKAEGSCMIRHKGPLVPTCIITSPPETDSDGVKWVIEMEDSVTARIPTNLYLRETPIVVLTDAEAQRLDLTFLSPQDYEASISAFYTTNPADFPSNDVLRLDGVASNGTVMTWSFAWQVTNAGSYSFKAEVWADNSTNKYTYNTNTAFRSATVRFTQLAHVTDTNDLDWDDDGILNTRENNQIPLPEGQSEYWTQDEVFDWRSTGKTSPSSPDTDGDGLPDGLELGYRVAPESGTDFGEDTNGDGWPNYIWDRDPPFYNSCQSWAGRGIPNVTTSTEGGDRTAVAAGSVTDPRNPDSDYDGLPDGIEDANRNGWVDGDGETLSGYDIDFSKRNWPNNKIDFGVDWTELWEETSPNNADSDADGLSDGYGEDTNANGYVDLFLRDQDGNLAPLTPADYATYGIGIDYQSTANSASADPKPYTSRAINYDALFAAFNVTDADGSGAWQTNGWPRLVILETDPLCTDTDHDGLPDGWETRYSLDPLITDVYNFRTGDFVADTENGANGNPDRDSYIQNGEIVPYNNLAEFKGGTNPRAADSSATAGSESSIDIGDGALIGSVNDKQYFNEFLDWTLDDLVALDDYNQGGNSCDIYRCGDGYDSSRDMVAFYFRDGGDPSQGGDGKLYFRVDFDDLLPYAEESSLNIYVAMNFGNYGDGNPDLPDGVNCKTEMGWHAVSGVYDSQHGVLHVQGSTSTEGFLGAYFNSQLDAVAWSIDRSKLVAAGWNGIGDNLLFQVYTTRDFTNDDGGSGDKGGLNDFTDTIGDDWLCSDYWNDYNNIAQNGKFTTCVTKGNPNYGWNNRNAHAKLALVAHGNQAVEPGSTIQSIVDNGSGAGYQRPVKIHNIYTNCPLNLHITPTLAMGLQWAAVGNEKSWFSGPDLNRQIRAGVANGNFALLGSTFSDHIPRFFPAEFNRQNVALANDVLEAIYGEGAVSTNVFWLPERVADWESFHAVADLGYKATVIDQTPHLLGWRGRGTTLGSEAYKIQRFWLQGDNACEVKAFALASAAEEFRYVNTDSGLPTDLRHLFLRRARSGEVALSSIFYMWEELAQNANADAYDTSLRWIANHPWLQAVTLEQALVDERLANSLSYADLYPTNAPMAHDWVHHACNTNYANWFYGSGRHEGLAPKVFEDHAGHALTNGMPWGSATNGIFQAVWAKVGGITNASVRRLALEALFASVYESAFHEEINNNLSRWSYGDYMDPATGWYWDDWSQSWQWRKMGLQSFAWRAQSLTRQAALYAEVDAWANSAETAVQVLEKDVDVDGEKEYILRNGSVMALFEREGGLMVGAWFKSGANVFQMVGNPLAIPENGYEDQEPYDIAYWEEENEARTRHAKVAAQRAVALKDVSVGSGDNFNNLVHEMFAVSTDASSITFAGGGLTKTVSLANAGAKAFNVSYSASGKTMYVRCALSPDMDSLLRSGQSALSESEVGDTALTVSTRSSAGPYQISATLNVSNGSVNKLASDQPDPKRNTVETFSTVNMRNMAHARQVELSGTDALVFSLEFDTDTVADPPVITIDPDEDEMVIPLGETGSCAVTTTDGDLSADVLPSINGVSATFEGGVFSWEIPVVTLGGRTYDIVTNVTFTAVNAAGSTNRTVVIRIPWDSDGNGIGDDWEYRQCRAAGKEPAPLDPTKDDDHDGFSNYAEWVAGTNPNLDGSYIGWERQDLGDDGLTLTFRSIPGATYHIEGTDTAGLVAGTWDTLELGVVATNVMMSWTDTHYSEYTNRMYRIKIPFYTQR